jgi:hypothetical protein
MEKIQILYSRSQVLDDDDFASENATAGRQYVSDQDNEPLR